MTQTIAPLPDRSRELALIGYREIAEAERMMHAESRSPGNLARAEYAEARIAGLERDGVIDWSVESNPSVPIRLCPEAEAMIASLPAAYHAQAAGAAQLPGFDDLPTAEQPRGRTWSA